MRWTVMPGLVTGVVGTLAVMSPSSAQPEEYRNVNVGEIIMGYVPDGTLVRTGGHVWFREAEVLLNVNVPSAHVPLRVDVSGVPVGRRTEWAACLAPGQDLGGGCGAVVRGRTGMVDGRRGIFAQGIEIQAAGH